MQSHSFVSCYRLHPIPLALIAGSIGLALMHPLAAAAATSAGGAISQESRANAHTAGYQDSPLLATNAVGDFVVAWRSDGQDGSSDGVYARAWRADGSLRTGEIRVNRSTQGVQRPTHLAIDADGDFAVLWAAYGEDGTGYGSFVRAYAADGTPRTTELPVESASQHRGFPQFLAMDGDGDFVAHWTGFDGSGIGVWLRAYLADGTPRRAEQRVNVDTAGDQWNPLVATGAADGAFAVAYETPGSLDAQFFDAAARRIGGATVVPVNATLTHAAAGADTVVVVWTRNDGSGRGAYARAFHADGRPRTDPIGLSTWTTNSQTPAALAVSPADGDFVVVWSSAGQDGSGDGVYARAFEGTGVARTPAFRVNSQVLGDQTPGLIAMDPSGRFVVAWRGRDGSGSGVFARSYGADATPRSGELAVNNATAGEQSPEQLAIDATGDFVLAWTGSDEDGSSVRARLFFADGAPASPEFAMNEATTGSQQLPRIALDEQGHFAAAWTSTQLPGANEDVMVRRFAGTAAVDLSLALSGVPATLYPNESFSYQLEVTNEHAVESDPLDGLAHGVRIVASLPHGAFTGFAGAGWNCTYARRIVYCRHPAALLPGTSSSLRIDLQAPPNTNNPFMRHAVTLEAAQYDPDQADNLATAETPLSACLPGQLKFRVSRIDVVEGETARARIDRTETCGAVSVDYHTESQASIQPDFVATSGTLSFADGQATANIFVPTIEDSHDEGGEFFQVVLTNPTGGATADDRRDVRIIDDD